MEKRNVIIKALSFILAGLIAIVGLIYQNILMENKYNNYVSQLYSRYMEEFAVAINGINIMLEKSMYVSSPKQLNTVSINLYHQCETAKNALSQLPSFSGKIGSINKFLSQTGNYMISLSKDTIQNGKIPEEQIKNIEKLRNYSNTLTKKIDELQINYTDVRWIAEINEEISQIDNEFNFTNDLYDIEQGLTDYPTLIYDGPYSDHVINNKPKYLDNNAIVTKERAKEIAAQTFEIDISELSYDEEEKGEIEAYRFNSENTIISVSKSGGHIVYFRKTPLLEKALFTQEQAIERAKEYLQKHSSLKFEPTYCFSDEGTCTINFVYKDGATLCYTDLIKIGVCLNTGEVVLVEARGFLMNHKSRTIQTPSYTKEEAAVVLSKDLKINSVSQVLIPVDNREVHCYEFRCNGKKGDEILIYINTQNLEEEQIFIVLNTFGGTLVK